MCIRDRHYPADPSLLRKQVAGAPERQRVQTARAIQETVIQQVQPVMRQYKEPDLVRKITNKTLAANYKATHPEEPAILENKHYQKFAENVAMPMIEGAVLDGAGRFMVKGLGYLFRGTAAQEASSLAKSWQGNGAYPGVDAWRNITLKEGSYVAGGLPLSLIHI